MSISSVQRYVLRCHKTILMDTVRELKSMGKSKLDMYFTVCPSYHGLLTGVFPKHRPFYGCVHDVSESIPAKPVWVLDGLVHDMLNAEEMGK